MIAGSVALALIANVLLAASQAAPTCTSAPQCRQLARDAIADAQFERAHDLAWLAYQRARQDPETLTLLARAQSLSGRGDDAFVMLRRLAEAGVFVEDAATSADFARARSHAQWPSLQQAFERLASNAKPAADTKSIEASPAPAREIVVPPTPSAAPRRGKSETSAPKSETTTPKLETTAPKAEKAPLVSEPPSPKSETAAPEEVVTEKEEAAAVKLAGEDLALPAMPFVPAALVYDAVSARFILSASGSDALTVLSQTSANAAALTSRGWSGLERTTALAIDRAAGDLWVAVQGGTQAAVHRLQLISGRRLAELTGPDDQPIEIASMLTGRDGLYVLDRHGRRVLRRTGRATAMESYAKLADELTPLALAQSSAALYVAHADGVVRIDPGSRRAAAVTATGKVDLGMLHSLAWHDGVLLAIQRRGDERRVVRLRLNGAGTRVTRVETLSTAASDAATLAAGVYYYFADDDSGTRVVRAIAAR